MAAIQFDPAWSGVMRKIQLAGKSRGSEKTARACLPLGGQSTGSPTSDKRTFLRRQKVLEELSLACQFVFDSTLFVDCPIGCWSVLIR